MNEPNYALMRDIEQRYQKASGLTDRRYYSLFYGPLARFPIAVVNENPGGSPDDFQIVDVMAGQHELVEGRDSGPTTRNTAELMLRLLDARDAGALRSLQLFNQHFRRSRSKVPTRERRLYLAEAQPFLMECLSLVSPRLIVFAGASQPAAFMKRIGGQSDLVRGVYGPHWGRTASYYHEYRMDHPELGALTGVGIIHPSAFRTEFWGEAFDCLKAQARLALNH